MAQKLHAQGSNPPAPWYARALRRPLGLRGQQDPPDDPTHFVEPRWPILVAIVVAVLLYGSLPDRLTLGPAWVAQAVELALLLPLVLTEPHWHPGAGWPWQRVVSLVLTGAIQVSNLISLGLLVTSLLGGATKATGAALIVEAGKIWLTNVVVFGLWYWEIDRGGPRARHMRESHSPDFLFPQMTAPDVAPAHWMPIFVDYLYLAFTNAMAFSPTDTLPLTPRVKALMLIQALISLLTIALVAARAVNILS